MFGLGSILDPLGIFGGLFGGGGLGFPTTSSAPTNTTASTIDSVALLLIVIAIVAVVIFVLYWLWKRGKAAATNPNNITLVESAARLAPLMMA